MFAKDGMGKDIYRILLYGIGLTSISAMVWLAGPYVVIGDWHPLDNYIIREVVTVVLVGIFISVSGWSIWQRRKKAKALTEGLEGEAKAEDDKEELGLRMKDALETLKTTGGGKTDFLYDLPWYIIIGPPGSGKTTALVNSGLKFPLSGKGTPAAKVLGSGGTRYCDWWFTEDAVLIDTAGRYTTQDSDAKTDKKSWFAFLDLLKQNRPRQPINGVLVAISLQDVLALGPDELAAHARAIRARLLELHDQLKVDFPVYALFTKGDLVAGFTEYFGNLGDQSRRQVWGATFQTNDKTKNLVSDVPDEFDTLIERLNFDMPDRLQEEPHPATRAALYGFPAQMSALKRPLYEFLNSIFEPTRYHASATLRGFYFTSGTQQGTPIDQLINALVKNFGASEVAPNSYSGLGKSFFLADLVQKVIIGEAAWVSTDPKAVRRQRLWRAAAWAVIVGIFAASAGAWWVSYKRNEALIASVEGAGKEYLASAGNLPREDIVADRAYDKVLPLLQKLRQMPSGYTQKDASVPMAAGFGLSQWDRLESSSVQTYRLALERLFRPRLLYRLEEVLDARRNDPGYVYDALKVYLMLGGQRAVDRDLVVSWEMQDWTENLYPGPAQEPGRKALQEQLVAMLDLEAGRPPLVDLSASVIDDSQKTLARLSVSQRAYELLRSQARSLNIPDWISSRSGGPDFERVFEAVGGGPLDAVRVPGFYTYAGFQRAFVDRLPGIKERVESEKWVLGNLGEQKDVADQYTSLPTDLLALYRRDYIAVWRATLAKMRVRSLTSDKPRYQVLAAAAAPNSPFKTLFESIRDETALTKERPEFKKPPPAAGQTAPAAPDGAALLAVTGQPPGAQIEAAFRPFHAWADAGGGRRQIDELVGALAEIDDNLRNSANVASQAAQANFNLQTLVQKFRSRASLMPDPFKDQMLRAAAAFQSDVDNSELGILSKALNDQVAGVCRSIVEGRSPFAKGASSEIAMQDFGRVFGGGGVLDRFFQASMAKYVNTSKPAWALRPDQPVTKLMSATTVRQFQLAAQIRDAFFSGGQQPQVAITIFPPVLSGTGVTAKFEVNGQTVVTQAGTSVSAQAVTWPAGGGRTAVILAYDAPPPPPPPAPSLFGGTPPPAPPPVAPPPSVLEKTTPWGLFRLFDGSAPVQRGDRMAASFIVGGRELQYQFSFGTRQNPYLLPALREFRCPQGI